MKRIIAYFCTFLVWMVCVSLFAIFGTSSSISSDTFVVLAVKEDSTKDYNSMPVFLDLKEDTGVDVKYIYNTSTQYTNNTDPVSIKGIDAIYHTGFSNLKMYDYGRRGRIVAIDQYLSSMPNFKKILEDRPDIAEALRSPDGHIYALPRIEEMGLKEFPNILYLNKKWVLKLLENNQLPSNVTLTKDQLVDGLDLTREQFKAILQRFNDLDMDNDGSTTNEIPLSFVSCNWQGNEADLMASFGIAENRDHKTIINDEVVFTCLDETWFKAVKELSIWYNSGLIRSSAFTQTDSDFLAKGQDGRYGAFYWWEKNTVVNKPEDYIIVKPLIDDNTGKRYVGVSNELEIEKGECVVLESCEGKEELLSYFDKFLEPDYSAQINYGSISSGAFLKEKIDGKLIPNDDHGAQSADDFRLKNAPFGVTYLVQDTWDKYVEMESRAKLRLSNLESYVKPYRYEGAKPIPHLNYTSDELVTLNIYESTLANNIASWYTNAVTGGGLPSKDSWQAMIDANEKSFAEVKRINQAGYDRYLGALR